MQHLMGGAKVVEADRVNVWRWSKGNVNYKKKQKQKNSKNIHLKHVFIDTDK